MTSGSAVFPSILRRWIAGTVSRFIGAGVGLARLVEVSIVKVVDMAPHSRCERAPPASQSAKCINLTLC